MFGELAIGHGYLAVALDAIVEIFGKLFSRFHWTSMLSAGLIAFFVWLWQRRNGDALARKGFLKFLFPKWVWFHPSALLDYRFVIFDKVVLALLIGTASAAYLSFTGQSVTEAGKAAVENATASSLNIAIAYTVVLLLVEDFFRYWAHRLMHWSPLLWHFHKIHHSPEVLVPLTQLRTHPVNGLVNLARSAIAIPVATVPFLLLFPGELTAVTIFGINAGRFAFDMLGAQLRHSHVWLSFWPWLSKIIISPAQHQIHHSRAREHRNRNFGSQFALWDWMFGTIYIPERREKLRFGIGGSDNVPYRSIADLYLRPFRDARQYLKRRGRWPFGARERQLA